MPRPRGQGPRAVVAAFVSLQRALLLKHGELDVFTRLCFNSLRTEFRWYPESFLMQRVEDECRDYIWRDCSIQSPGSRRRPRDATLARPVGPVGAAVVIDGVKAPVMRPLPAWRRDPASPTNHSTAASPPLPFNDRRLHVDQQDPSPLPSQLNPEGDTLSDDRLSVYVSRQGRSQRTKNNRQRGEVRSGCTIPLCVAASSPWVGILVSMSLVFLVFFLVMVVVVSLTLSGLA